MLVYSKLISCECIAASISHNYTPSKTECWFALSVATVEFLANYSHEILT